MYDCLRPKVFYSLREGVACSMTHFKRFCMAVSLCAVGIRTDSRGIARIGFLVCTSQSGSNHHPNVVLVKVISYIQRAKIEIIETFVYLRTPFHPQGPTEEEKKKTKKTKKGTQKRNGQKSKTEAVRPCNSGILLESLAIGSAAPSPWWRVRYCPAGAHHSAG